jgi:hypothetical protein
VKEAAAVRHGRSRSEACSVVWDGAEAPALGSAPIATFWLALEQNGPWGAKAATQSHLDPELGRDLDQMCRAATGRFLLIRRPGTHADQPEGNRQRVYVAGALTSRPWLLEADLDDPARLTRLDGDTLRGGDIDAVTAALPELRISPAPVLLICANSRRDVCCSVRGRPVACESSSQRQGQVWECSHTGGHRFAPTGVLLPYGQVYGRLSGASAVSVIDAASRGEVPTELLGPTYDRGRSHLETPAQAAESMVREDMQEPRLLALSTTASPRPGNENAWNCRVSHVDGRWWDVLAVRGPRGADLPESCGKAPVTTWQWSVVIDSGR